MPLFVDIAFPLTSGQIFTYSIPSEMRASARVGARVFAPLAKRKLIGFIVCCKDETQIPRLRPLLDVLDVEPAIDAELMRLAQWIADYYLSPLGDVLKAMVPSSMLKSPASTIQLTTATPELIISDMRRRTPRLAAILEFVAKKPKTTLRQLQVAVGGHGVITQLSRLQKAGLIRIEERFSGGPRTKMERIVRFRPAGLDGLSFESFVEAHERRLPAQMRCLTCLKRQGRPISQKELLRQSSVSASVVKALQTKGLVEIEKREVRRDYYQGDFFPEAQPVRLNSDQQESVEAIVHAIKDGVFSAFLLFGVTGSGKTQVYIEAIHETLRLDKQAIVLVPEISLTPQTVQRFKAHFGDEVAVLHSAMSVGERYDSWRAIREGRAKIAIGPRSAIFAPFQNLGLIVVDEEHESSYKQDSEPRYHARDVALVRAKLLNASVILGSATPSAESMQNARAGKLNLLELPQRASGVAMPKVEIIDMMTEKRLSGTGHPPIFSRLLLDRIEAKIQVNEQAILMLNRRGFASFVKCQDCGYTESCDDCNITLTFHLGGRRLRCHYCGLTRPSPARCPECDGADILFRGVGTQQVEAELAKNVSHARVIRMDFDTTGEKRSHDKILKAFGRGDYDILLGTQMVAKGLDFSRVTLVGVINADTGLFLPDFRASERTFQLMTQVAGRAGRKNLQGEVIIQTFSPHNVALVCAREHDFRTFFDHEVRQRHEARYPPYGRLACVVLSGPDQNEAREAASAFVDILEEAPEGLRILGPAPSPIERIKKNYRFQVLLKATHGSLDGPLQKALRQARERFVRLSNHQSIRLTIDIDPVSML